MDRAGELTKYCAQANSVFQNFEHLARPAQRIHCALRLPYAIPDPSEVGITERPLRLRLLTARTVDLSYLIIDPRDRLLRPSRERQAPGLIPLHRPAGWTQERT